MALSDDEINRWLLLRSIEWLNLPAFVSSPFAPILFIFFPWYWVLVTILILGVLWSSIRYRFVNVAIATIFSYCDLLAWPAAIGSAIYLFIHHRYFPAIIALVWPPLAGCIGIPGKPGIIEHAFAQKIGLIPPDDQSHSGK